MIGFGAMSLSPADRALPPAFTSPGFNASRWQQTVGVFLNTRVLLLFGFWLALATRMWSAEPGPLEPLLEPTTSKSNSGHLIVPPGPTTAQIKDLVEQARQGDFNAAWHCQQHHLRQTRHLSTTAPTSAFCEAVAAATWGWYLLFDTTFAHARQVPENRCRLVGIEALYNQSVEWVVRLSKAPDPNFPQVTLPLPPQAAHPWGGWLRAVPYGFGWQLDDMESLHLVSDFEAGGFRTHFAGTGLGVPLIVRLVAPRKLQQKATGLVVAAAHCQPYDPLRAAPRVGRVLLAATALVRPVTPLVEMGTNPTRVQLDLFNPLEAVCWQLGTESVRLAYDLTTPLAVFLHQEVYRDFRIRGFFHPEDYLDKTGLYLFEPYRGDKIPLVLVHGLYAGMETWAEFLNEFQARPELYHRFQPLLFLYPTGMSYLWPTVYLHRELTAFGCAARQKGLSAAEHVMVVGHSMGGLVAKRISQNADTTVWERYFRTPPGQLQGSPADVQLARELFFYRRVPEVQRVVFIATPHRGSIRALPPLSWLGLLIERPEITQDFKLRLRQENPKGTFRLPFGSVLERSVFALTPWEIYLKVTANLPLSPEVRYHSIIAKLFPAPNFLSSDGVVTYHSTHIDGVDSERIFRGSHVCQDDYPVILEVFRLMKLHYAQTQASLQIGWDPSLMGAPISQIHQHPEVNLRRKGKP